MKKTSFSLIALAVLALVETAQAYPVRLIAHNQRSSSGALSVLKWSGCTNYTGTGASATPCINPANVNLANMGITPSTAVWDWNPTTGVLSMTGAFNTASTISSSGSAAASAVIGDKVTNLSINTSTHAVTASSYACGEGNFLANVGANGCLNLSLGVDGVLNSTVVYNVGGNANCVQRTIGGDDVSTGNVRTLVDTAGGGGCDPGDGAFDLFTIESDNTGTGGQLIISNGSTTANSANFMTFARSPQAVDDAASVVPTVATNIDVLANDVAFTDPVTVAIGTLPGKGTATITGTNPGPKAGIRIRYTSNSGATGTDSFTYTVTDADGITNSTATVNVTILNVGANPDIGTTTRNQPITINVGANDTGFTGPVTVTITSPPDHGGAVVPGAAGPVASASVLYTPSSAAGSAGYDEHFTYQITDGVFTDTAIVTVTVNNTQPVAGTGTITISTVGTSPGSATGTFTAPGVGGNLGNTPSVVTLTAPAAGKGTATVSGSTVTYTPNGTFFAGTDTFGYTITDLDGETASGTVTVTIPNGTPALAAASISATSGTASTPRALTITAGNGTVAQHTLAVTTQAANGSCVATAGASPTVRYTSNSGYTGSDSCTLTVTDGAGHSATGVVTITVSAASSSGGGVGGGGNILPGGGGALDLWALSLLGAGVWLRRKRQDA